LIKTDRRDASSLARLLRSGELTPTWVPDHPSTKRCEMWFEHAKTQSKINCVHGTA
jgi:hypothetical protein